MLLSFSACRRTPPNPEPPITMFTTSSTPLSTSLRPPPTPCSSSCASRALQYLWLQLRQSMAATSFCIQPHHGAEEHPEHPPPCRALPPLLVCTRHSMRTTPWLASPVHPWLNRAHACLSPTQHGRASPSSMEPTASRLIAGILLSSGEPSTPSAASVSAGAASHGRSSPLLWASFSPYSSLYYSLSLFNNTCVVWIIKFGWTLFMCEL